MKKKMVVYKTVEEPVDYVPFVMVPGSIFRAYNAGELNSEQLLVYLMLSKKVNPHNGIGATNYAEIAAWLKLKTDAQSNNHINKLMLDLRDENEIVWFSNHSGSRAFEYQLAEYKLAKNSDNEPPKWVDIVPHFPTTEQKQSRVNTISLPKPPPEQKPRHPPPEQRLQRSNGEGIKSLGDIISERESRPPYTDTES
ncbi:MAG TPA: hypothetical protein VJG67_03870 [Candidatus Paceibacterota bacterium]